MTHIIDTVLIKVASRCNINCNYCYIFNMGDTGWMHQPKIITEDTVDNIAELLRNQIKVQNQNMEIVLHGGEPLLIGTQKLEKILSLLRQYIPLSSSISIQTNGILITKEILDICSKYAVNVSISLDGPEKVHNQNRIDFLGKGTHEKVLIGIETIKNHENTQFLFSGLLAVIELTSSPKEIYDFFKIVNPPSVDFLNRDGNHINLPYGKASFESTEYGEWLVKLFDLYIQDENPVPIRIFDDIIKLLFGGNNSKEGIGINEFGILVIDTDGSITKNDTLKSSFSGADCFSQKWTVFDNTDLQLLISSQEYQSYHQSQKSNNSKCRNCDIFYVCGGGMPVHRWDGKSDFAGPTVYCEDNQLLIRHIYSKVITLLKEKHTS